MPPRLRVYVFRAERTAHSTNFMSLISYNACGYKEDVSFANGTGWSFPEHIELTATELWTPSFRLVNCEVQDCLIAATNNTIALLHSNGRVQLSLHKQLEATCQLALKNFPFDEQNCGLTFILAHLHRVSDYELRALNQIDLDYMHDNDEWNVESFTHAPERVEIFMLNPYNRDKENGHWTQRREVSDQLSIRANLQLSRHPDYYICYIIVPTIVITIADLLTVIVPMETKLELSVTVLLAFTFLQGLVASSTPKVPEIPLLGLYILFALILSGVNLIVVVATLAIYNIGEEHSRPPLWLRVIGIQIWRWPLQAARRFFRYVRSRLRDRHTPPAAATSMATKEHLTVEAESQKCHEHPENPTKSAANSSFDECVAKQPDESWKVLARYQELIASALFIALQAYIFFKYLYPLLDLWAGHQKHKSYFQYP